MFPQNHEKPSHPYHRNTFYRVLTVVVLVSTVWVSQTVPAKERIRPGILADQGWYPGDPKELADSIQNYLNQVPERTTSTRQIKAAIVPHAGHRYSGKTAAYVYKAVAKQPYNRVMLLGPSHHAAFRGASIASVDAFETPLGKVPLDRQVCDALLQSETIHENDDAHRPEHCLEIQLPFLQTVLPDVKIVPLLIGYELTPEECMEIAGRIKPFLDEKTLLMISSDFTHQGANFHFIPYAPNTPLMAIPPIIRALDFRAVNDILTQNLRGYWQFVDRSGITICGRNAIKILLAALPAQTSAGVLHYETSGEITGDYQSSVSYCAIAFYDEPTALNESEESTLLTIARNRLSETLVKGEITDYQPDESHLTDRLKEPKGVFVTLTEHEQLRGCIGLLEPVLPLHEAVADRVLHSAFKDTRFRPVQKDEIEAIDIEISVMTPLQEVSSVDDIVLGRDGMTVEKNGKSAIYLPQVALSQGWDLTETLSHLCEKAGMTADDWKEGCSFRTFQAQVFGERFKDLNGLTP